MAGLPFPPFFAESIGDVDELALDVGCDDHLAQLGDEVGVLTQRFLLSLSR